MDTQSDVDFLSDNEEPQIAEETSEDEKRRIREEVSQMSFEDLQKLKEQIGSKMYAKAVFGTDEAKPKQRTFKRVNKNRPREMSSKIRPQIIKRANKATAKSKNHVARDPRFDSNCGEFDKEKFRKNYKFIDDVRKDEQLKLKNELSVTKDPQIRQQIKLLMQRISNQLRENDKFDQKASKMNLEKEEIRAKRQKGEKPIFKKKSEKKIEDLVEKYEELKKNNRLEKHIEKRSKILMGKERKKMSKVKT